MKPDKIILVRHGQSQGNVDSSMYEHTPDYQLELTDLGIEQAKETGKKLREIIGQAVGFGYNPNNLAQFYVSPLWRTRSTFKAIIEGGRFDKSTISWQEEPRIREQEWGHLREVEESIIVNEMRDSYGSFYFRCPDGESGADVYDRVSGFMGSLHRDFEKQNFPNNAVIITHGMAMRLFLMKWFHWTVEEFEEIRNPQNCQMIILERNHKNKYDLTTPIIKYEVPPHYKLKNQKPLIF